MNNVKQLRAMKRVLAQSGPGGRTTQNIFWIKTLIKFSPLYLNGKRESKSTQKQH